MNCPYITKTGDKGKTSIMNKRVYKNSDLIQFLGGLDEINSYIGLIVNYAPDNLKKTLMSIQNQLLNIGGFISGGSIEINDKYHSWVEAESNEFFKALENANNFVLPGGSILSSHLHIARCVIRRVEILFWKLDEDTRCDHIAKYMNRLSDLFFVLSRLHGESKECLWQIGEIDYDIK
ncbi:cob(I)yrinic acid a,c-diamide adenosyltransferase [Candidatus Cytomitobacter primus]|uniref:Corrinoid adenosyltransferase n=1 Tax=Candidatus Cytomitobacter primus TaxID=2066024 RepID=A0A5C0UFS2_9PROT|nr:cob(I)yrinic acid a,c-diamide adenosyltransferase [Candidatus Cytomitobacter primus]QEK38531.1 cob(I)yrinic acid a,c-diamide adenosyltransferase [Candidatus Cytomitobacter primus]